MRQMSWSSLRTGTEKPFSNPAALRPNAARASPSEKKGRHRRLTASSSAPSFTHVISTRTDVRLSVGRASVNVPPLNLNRHCERSEGIQLPFGLLRFAQLRAKRRLEEVRSGRASPSPPACRRSGPTRSGSLKHGALPYNSATSAWGRLRKSRMSQKMAPERPLSDLLFPLKGGLIERVQITDRFRIPFRRSRLGDLRCE
jgi:hypothetical protein